MRRNTSAGVASFSGAALQLYTDEDLQSLHVSTLEVLERTGVSVGSKEAIEYFERGGAIVDYDTEIVKIPGYMVEEAIKSAPASVFLAGKDPKYDIIMEQGRVYYCPFGLGIEVVDPYTGELRESTKKDIADCARLIDYLDEYDFCFDTMVARDVHPNVACIHGFEAPLLNTKKAVLASPTDSRTAQILIDMGATASGGLDKLQERPIMMNGCCTISPLFLPDGTCETIIETAKNRLPLMVLSMAMSGGMSPVTLAGTVVVMNAELLAALTLAQLVNKGTPFVYGTSTGTLDLRRNAAAMVGTPELALISASAAVLARMYNIPSLVAGT